MNALSLGMSHRGYGCLDKHHCYYIKQSFDQQYNFNVTGTLCGKRAPLCNTKINQPWNEQLLKNSLQRLAGRDLLLGRLVAF